jgi:CDAN1-interacting nuclease 1
MLRYCIGEEYEVKLKKQAKDANLIFYDENDLRRVGYDKTPDLLCVPFLYKNTIINWIESKAMFSDLETHVNYFKTQLSCYENRFGTGIVIYWFGFQEAVLNTKSNIIILDDFPEKQFITTLKEFDVK